MGTYYKSMNILFVCSWSPVKYLNSQEIYQFTTRKLLLLKTNQNNKRLISIIEPYSACQTLYNEKSK